MLEMEQRMCQTDQCPESKKKHEDQESRRTAARLRTDCVEDHLPTV